MMVKQNNEEESKDSLNNNKSNNTTTETDNFSYSDESEEFSISSSIVTKGNTVTGYVSSDSESEEGVSVFNESIDGIPSESESNEKPIEYHKSEYSGDMAESNDLPETEKNNKPIIENLDFLKEVQMPKGAETHSHSPRSNSNKTQKPNTNNTTKKGPKL